MPGPLLFVTLAGHGHVTPTLPLVTELVRRGHRVDYATGPEHLDPVAAAGARPVELPGMVPYTPPAQVGPDTVVLFLRHFFAALCATYPVLREHCAGEDRPRLIVYDSTNWPARLVAEQSGIPAVRTVPNLASNERFSLFGPMTAGLGADHPEMTAYAADCARFADQNRVGLDIAGTMDVAEPTNLVFVPRGFQPCAETFDDRFHFVGPVLGDRERREPWSPQDPDRPLLYISLGTIFTDHPEFYRTCLDAFDDGAWQVAMTVGDVEASALGPIPSTVEVRPRFPQLTVLRHAAAFVSHAGMNSTMEALHHAVPLLTLPQMPEQVANADRLAELGLGRRLDHDGRTGAGRTAGELTAEELRTAVTGVVTDPAVRANLDRMRPEATDGTGRAVDVIESRLA